jgi:hypothetical protein
MTYVRPRGGVSDDVGDPVGETATEGGDDEAGDGDAAGREGEDVHAASTAAVSSATPVDSGFLLRAAIR